MKELLNRLRTNFTEDPNLLIEISEQIVKKTSDLSYQQKATFYFIYGWAQLQLSKEHEALKNFEEALNISRENGLLLEESQALMGKGQVLANTGNIIQGIEAITKSIEIAKQIKNYKRIIGTTIIYSRILANLGEYDNSISTLKEILPLAKKNDYLTNVLYRMLALDFTSNSQIDEAVVLIKRAINREKKANGKSYSYFQTLVVGLRIYFETIQFKLFEKTLSEALELLKIYKVPSLQLDILELHALYLLEKQDYNEAFNIAKKAESLITESGNNKNLEEFYKIIKTCLLKLGKIEASVEYYEKLYNISKENQEQGILRKQAIEEMIQKNQWQQKMNEVEGQKNNEISNYIETIDKLRTELKDSKKRITQLSNHDPLTQLPNRILLKQFFSQIKSRAKRNKEQVALFSLDIEHFKRINNTYGFNAGDKTLCELAERLNNLLRGSDVVGRVGDDEFVLICCEINKNKDIKTISEKVEELITKPVFFEGRQIEIKAKIGHSVFPDDGNEFDILFKNASSTFKENK